MQDVLLPGDTLVTAAAPDSPITAPGPLSARRSSSGGGGSGRMSITPIRRGGGTGVGSSGPLVVGSGSRVAPRSSSNNGFARVNSGSRGAVVGDSVDDDEEEVGARRASIGGRGLSPSASSCAFGRPSNNQLQQPLIGATDRGCAALGSDCGNVSSSSNSSNDGVGGSSKTLLNSSSNDFIIPTTTTTFATVVTASGVGGDTPQQQQQQQQRTMTLWQLVAFTLFVTAGGPMGMEPAVKASGAPPTLTAIAIIPFIYCLPIALVTAELSTTYPENGGTVVFTMYAFKRYGRAIAFQIGFWNVVANIANQVLRMHCMACTACSCVFHLSLCSTDTG